MIGTLPSCQAPSKKVQVWEKLTAAVVWAMITIHAAGQRQRIMAPNSLRISLRNFLQLRSIHD
jgi:hypothetical protein